MSAVAVALALAAATMESAAVGAEQPSRQPREPIRTSVSQPTEDGFDWLDAAIGGAAVLGIALLVSGMSLVVQRSGQQRVLGDIEPMREEKER